MTEKASLQKYIELLEAKKSQTLVSLQKKIVFNVSGFYEFILLHLESLASSDACLDELNSSLESEIAKGIDFYHISLLAALSESFNLQSVFPFLGAKKSRKAQPKPVPDNSRQPVDEQSMDGSENYASDYSGMIECEINTGDDADSLASDDKSDQTYKPHSKDATVYATKSGPTKRQKRDPSSNSTDRQTHPCTEVACGKIFTSASNLARHQLTHSGDRPHTCTECGKTFTRKTHLQEHERIHSGEMSHACSWPGCSYKAAYPSSVFKHIRLRHFQLPPSKREQTDLGIVDNRDAHQYCVAIGKTAK